MTADVELLPCPFCGEGEHLLVEHLEGTILHPAHRILCDNCGASTGYTDKDFRADWNTRANALHHTAAQAAEIEALRAEVERLQSAFEQAVEADKDEEVQRLHAEKVAHFIARTDAEAEVKALRSEMERLRVELEIAKGQGEFYRTQRNAQQRKAERLKEAEAKVSALRAEVGRWRTIATAVANGAAVAIKQAETRAEQLAEALQWYVDNDDTNEGQEGNEFWLAGRDRARALLREQEE